MKESYLENLFMCLFPVFVRMIIVDIFFIGKAFGMRLDRRDWMSPL